MPRPDESVSADLVREADRDRWLATLYAPAALRPALFAVWALDIELAKVVGGASDPMLAEIKLAWWRERLAELKSIVPAQPVLRALATEVLPRGVGGAALTAFEDGWLALLEGEVERYVALRGAAVGAVIGVLTGAEGGTGLATAWAAGEAARAGHSVAAPDRPRAGPPMRWLAGLAALGARDVARAAQGLLPEARATAGRQWVLLRAALTGR